MFFDLIFSSVFWQFLLLGLVIMHVSTWFSEHWKVKNTVPDRLPYGIVDNWLENKFPGYTKNGKLL